jgi:hypothetical protein
MRTPQICGGSQIPDAEKPVKQWVQKTVVPGDSLHKPGDQTE